MNTTITQNSTIEKALDILFPRFCVGCAKEGELLCDKCFGTQYRKVDRSICPICLKKRAAFPRICQSCARDIGFSKLVYSGRFEEVLREALHGLKFEDVREIGKQLGQRLAYVIATTELPPGIIVPMPLHPARSRQRGYNQAGIIAKTISQELNWPYLEALARVKYTKQQTKLNRGKRLENLKGAFASRFDFTDNKRPLYLIDDVITTGATMSSAAAVLKNAGARNITGVVVAAD